MHTDTEMLPTVCVLLSAYNGAQYLEEQIDSVLAQTGVNVFLDIRDDGSPEPAKDIYAKYAALPNVRIRYGENLKPTAAFWKLLEDADDYKYYAFCDQDDIWDSDKLVSAVNLLRAEDPDRYLIYCGANRQIDSEGNPLPENDPRYARLPVPPTVIERVLICRGTVQGCTMVINDRLRERVLRYKPDFSKIKGYHDRWLYRSNFVLGGKCVYDPVPHFSYRIHGSNASMKGKRTGKTGRVQKLKRTVRRFIRPMYCGSAAKGLYEAYREDMTPEVLECVKQVAFYRTNPVYRLRGIFLRRWHPNEKASVRLNLALRFLFGRI